LGIVHAETTSCGARRRPISMPVHRDTHLAWLPGVEPDTSSRGLDLLGFEVAAFMHDRDDEDLALAQVIEDAPGIGGNRNRPVWAH